MKAQLPHYHGMDAKLTGDPLPGQTDETAAEREARLRYEAAVIARGHAEIEAGLGIEYDDLKAWLLALDDDENTPLPAPRRRAPPSP